MLSHIETIKMVSYKPEKKFSIIKVSSISNPADFLKDFNSIESSWLDLNVFAI